MMVDKPVDVPLGNRQDSQPFGSPVIDFASVRVSHGLPKYHHKKCDHKTLVYSSEERRVWCEDCERTIENFEALMTIVRSFQEMESAAQHKLSRAAESEAAFLVRRAAKAVDRTWGQKMAVDCPHCRRGILAEDMEHHGAVSREIEIQRRKNAKAAE
jgi:hypothetical protein